MIYKGDKEVSARYYGSKAVSFVYKGATLIWQAVASCFGAGRWINTFPWKNDNAWKNN